jgi:hypothetical protein
MILFTIISPVKSDAKLARLLLKKNLQISWFLIYNENKQDYLHNSEFFIILLEHTWLFYIYRETVEFMIRIRKISNPFLESNKGAIANVKKIMACQFFF